MNQDWTLQQPDCWIVRSAHGTGTIARIAGQPYRWDAAVRLRGGRRRKHSFATSREAIGWVEDTLAASSQAPTAHAVGAIGKLVANAAMV